MEQQSSAPIPESSSGETVAAAPPPADATPTPGPLQRGEPLPARLLQLAILLLGLGLLLSALVGPRTGPLIVGLLLALSAVGPLRPYGDRWMAGVTEGRRANQIAALRLGIGLGLAFAGAAGVFA